MAWTTPPTFTNGTALQASDLNIIRDDLLHLNGTITGVNTPFSSAVYGSTNWTIAQGAWTYKRIGRYLHYRARVTDSDVATFEIRLDNVVQFSDTTQRDNPYTYSGYIDLDNLLSSQTINVGDIYTIHTEGTWASAAPRELILDYLWESDSTTL